MGSERMATSQGQLPLHLAIQNYPSQPKEIRKLLNRYPDATTAVDGKERLFPFQLAAVVTGKSQWNSKLEPKQKSPNRPTATSINTTKSDFRPLMPNQEQRTSTNYPTYSSF
jgi:hypothetical protein